MSSNSGRLSRNDAIWRSAGEYVLVFSAGWLFSSYVYRRYYSFNNHSTQQESSSSSWRIRFIDVVANLVSDILEHPSVDAALSHTIARGFNRWMISQDAQHAIQALVLQAPREQAVRELGKEVPGYVLNFAGGFVDAITGKGGNKLPIPAAANSTTPPKTEHLEPNNGDEDPSRNDSWTDLTN